MTDQNSPGGLRVLVYADFRSPHAMGWADGLEEAGMHVVRVSSEVTGLDGVRDPQDFLSRRRQKHVASRADGRSTPLPQTAEWIHTCVALARVPSRHRWLRGLVRTTKPDLLHALRLPYEGVTALSARVAVPVVISTWGQDFVPQSQDSRLLLWWVRRTLPRAAGIQVDALDDLERARSAGLGPGVPALFAAGNFGVDTTLFFPAVERSAAHVVYARGPQPYARPMLFLDAAKLVVERSDAHVTAVGLKGFAEAEAFVADHGLRDRVALTERLARNELATLLRDASVVVSTSSTDGTPNSLLEAVSSGANVVAVDIPSLREVRDRGLPLTLCDPVADRIAEAVVLELNAPRESGALPEPFSRAANRSRVARFYSEVLAARPVSDRQRSSAPHSTP